MSTTDGKAPRLEIVQQHEDGDIVIVLEATFRGDVRKVMDVKEDVTKEDAELAVASNIFNLVRYATQGGSDSTEDGAAMSED